MYTRQGCREWQPEFGCKHVTELLMGVFEHSRAARTVVGPWLHAHSMSKLDGHVVLACATLPQWPCGCLGGHAILGPCLPDVCGLSGETGVSRGFPATHIRHGADGGLKKSQDRRHGPGHGTWNMDRHVGELEALGQSWD